VPTKKKSSIERDKNPLKKENYVAGSCRGSGWWEDQSLWAKARKGNSKRLVKRER